MNLGDIMVLNKDNTFQKNRTKHVWGKKGDIVKIISISGNALIYEKVSGLKKGQRFPCNRNDVSPIEDK